MSDYDPRPDLERVERYVSEHGAGVDQVAAMDALRRLKANSVHGAGSFFTSPLRIRDIERIRELEAALAAKQRVE